MTPVNTVDDKKLTTWWHSWDYFERPICMNLGDAQTDNCTDEIIAVEDHRSSIGSIINNSFTKACIMTAIAAAEVLVTKDVSKVRNTAWNRWNRSSSRCSHKRFCTGPRKLYGGIDVAEEGQEDLLYSLS